jgi:hypothetical protein
MVALLFEHVVVWGDDKDMAPLCKPGMPVYEISPSVVAKLEAGHGNARAIVTYEGVVWNGYDEE